MRARSSSRTSIFRILPVPSGADHSDARLLLAPGRAAAELLAARIRAPEADWEVRPPVLGSQRR
uniref:Uncharacterized protein n=1 Tax=Arundo donax TaxID=35708 RepID=A0A0A9DGS7_ARUDO